MFLVALNSEKKNGFRQKLIEKRFLLRENDDIRRNENELQ